MGGLAGKHTGDGGIQASDSIAVDLSSQESGSAGDGEAGVGVGAFYMPRGEARDDCSALGCPLPLTSVGLGIVS